MAGNTIISIPHMKRVGCALSTVTGQVLHMRWFSSPMTPTRDADWTWDAVCTPSSGCLKAAARHPDPSSFKGAKAHSNSSSGLHHSIGEISQISVKVSKGHAFSLLFKQERKLGHEGGDEGWEFKWKV